MDIVKMYIGRLRLRVAKLLYWCRTPDGIGCIVLLALSLALRLVVAPRVLVQYDLAAYERWGELVDSNFFHVYSVGGAIPLWVLVPAYPPVALYLFGIMDKLYFGAGALLGISLSHNVMTSHGLKLYLKLPAILADEVFITLIYIKGTRVLPRLLAWLAAATYAFSPGILVTVLLWGQTDGIILLLIVIGFLCALRNKPVWCGIAFSLAVCFKVTPVVYVPLALVYLFRWGGLKQTTRGVVAFLATAFVVFLPYLLPPSFEVLALRANIARVESVEGLTGSHTAFNLWWLLGLQQQNASVPYFGPFSLTLTGEALFAVVLLIVALGIWRDGSPARLWAGAAIIALSFFTVTTLQFERYLFPALGLFFLAALYDRRYWFLYGIVSVTFAVNWEASILPCQCVQVTKGWSPALQQTLMLHLDGWQVSLINCCALLLSVAFFVWTQAVEMRAGKGLLQTRDGLLKPSAIYPAMSSGSSISGAEFALSGVGHLPQSGFPLTSHATAVSVTEVKSDPTSALRQKATVTQMMPKLKLHRRELNRSPYVSVVIPCYNEQGNIRPMYERLTAALGPVTPTYELVFVNNGSYDESAGIFDSLALADQRVSIINLSRNFGSQGAYTAGFAYASGDCVVGLDGDIQDPPEMIPEFIAKWLEGYDVVYGVRARRKASLPRRIGYKAFYRLLRRISYIDIPVDASDFALMDRRVVKVLNGMPERSRLIRGLRAFAGFSQIGIPYVRQERFSGKTTNSFRALFNWASLGIISFSFAPLSLISYLAGIVVALAAVALVIYTALYFIIPGAPQGFQTLLIAVLFLGGVQLLCLSIIGAYLGKIFEEVKGRPPFLVYDIQNDHHKQQTG